MKFLEKEHQYVEDNEQYTPVTYFLKSHQEYVDWDKVAAKKAKKDGVKKDDLLAQWADKRDTAAARGTAFHKMMEDKYTSNSSIQQNNRHYPVHYVPTVNNVKEDLSVRLENNTIYTEKMIWSRNYKVCGTADLVEVIDGYIHVKDYKTNERLDKHSWVNPRTGDSKKLLGPARHLDDCNFNLYQLQLNIYMFMLLQQNRHLKMGSMEILHIKFNEDYTEHTIEPHKVDDLQKIVREMFDIYKSKKQL